MKVEDRFLPSPDLRSTGVGRPAEVRPNGASPGRRGETGADSAGLSALSLHAARTLEKDSPELVSKISRLQETVANGTYAVPAAAVAGRLVDSLLQPDL